MTGPQLVWFEFDAMPARLLYGVLALRQRVFVLEQNCLYPDIDGRDPAARHLAALTDDGAVIGCLRLFGPDAAQAGDGARIGRLVTAHDARGQGVAAALLREALAEQARRWPGMATVISAQAHLQDYYRRFGFTAEGGIYDEDGIPHIVMRRRPQ